MSDVIPRICERNSCDRISRWRIVTPKVTVYLCDSCKVVLDHFLFTFGELDSRIESTRIALVSANADKPRVTAEYDIRAQRWRR